MPREICRWLRAGGDAYILLDDGTLLRRRGAAGKLAAIEDGLTYPQALAYIAARGGFRQMGGPRTDDIKPQRPGRDPKARRVSKESLAPWVADLPACMQAERKARTDAIQLEVRAELERLGELPAGWDEKEAPSDPYGKLKENHREP